MDNSTDNSVLVVLNENEWWWCWTLMSRKNVFSRKKSNLILKKARFGSKNDFLIKYLCRPWIVDFSVWTVYLSLVKTQRNWIHWKAQRNWIHYENEFTEKRPDSLFAQHISNGPVGPWCETIWVLLRWNCLASEIEIEQYCRRTAVFQLKCHQPQSIPK